MIHVDKIMLCTDFSDESKHAAPYAIDLAEHYNAELQVIHVFDETALDPVFFSFEGSMSDFIRDFRENFASKIEEFLSDFNTENIQIAPVLANGSPFVEIVRYAKLNGIDFIVAGTHGRSGLSHMLLGSTAEKIIRKAHCPVLTVRNPEFEFEMP